MALLKPAFGWPNPFNKSSLTRDLEAGVVGSILALPQAIALAYLAGMPPEYGVYASVIPVLVALLWGSSWFTLSGPNTAVSVMLAATITPFALIGSDQFIELVILLSLFVGLIQLGIGFLKLGAILDFISSTVILAVTQAVAIILIVSAVFSISLTGVSSGSGIFSKLITFYENFSSVNYGTLLIGFLTIVIGSISKVILPRYYLLIAMIIGAVAAYALKYFDVDFASNIPLLGEIPLSLDVFRLPAFDNGSIRIVAGQWDNALAIAFLGLMQTVIISRSIAANSGQGVTTQREIVGQGLANTLAPFVSAFAGSGSFNRSATNFQAGAKTPYAGVLGVLLLVGIVSLGQSLLSYIPSSVIAATLFLVGIGLIDLKQARKIFESSAEQWIFILTFSSSLLLGLNTGVLVGLFASLTVYLWHTSQPSIHVVEYLSRNGKLVKAISIDGNLFFGSIPTVEKQFLSLFGDNRSEGIVVIKTDHLSYIDIPAAALIIKAAQKAESEVYIYVSKISVLDILKKAGLRGEEIDELIILKDKSHPMKSILFPFQGKRKEAISATIDPDTLIQKIKKTALLSAFSDDAISTMLVGNPQRCAESGEIIVKHKDVMNEHLILINGELEIQQIWAMPDANDKSHTWKLSPKNQCPAVLLAASNNIRVRALTDARYVLLSADKIDNLLGWVNTKEIDQNDSSTVKLLHMVSASHHLPKEVIDKILTKIKPIDVDSGEVIVKEREVGNHFYLIESGEAEVVRTDPYTEEVIVLNQIGTGDSFGEEALIQNSVRNATIRMLTPGRLLVLSREDFEEYVQTELVKEIDADEAYQKLQNDDVRLIDCRYDMEFEDSHIEGALLIPLHELREHVHQLDIELHYLVYCRSGKRSKAATYLLRERNFSAVSIRGGIKNWPYEVIHGADC